MKLGSAIPLLALVTLSACSAGTQHVGSTDADGGVAGGNGRGTEDGDKVDGSNDTPSTTGRKRVFMTSTTYTGDLGGVEGADDKCALVADGANLGGTWKAWISSSTVNAIDRIDDVGPWYLVGETNKVFNNKSNLATTPLESVSLDENGNGLSSNYFSYSCHGSYCDVSTSAIAAWSGTDHGEWVGHGCSDWKSSDGIDGHAVTSSWSSYDAIRCNSRLRLFCIEQ